MFSKLIQKKLKNKSFKELLTGTVWVLFARLLSTAIGLLVTIIVARSFGSEMVGRLALVNSLLMIGAMICMLGFNTSVMRLLPEYRIKGDISDAYNVFSRMALIIFIISAVTFGLILCVKLLFPGLVLVSESIDELYLLVGLFIFIKSILQFNTQAMRGLKLVKAFAFIQFLPQLLNLLILLGFMMFFNLADAPVYALLLSLGGGALVAYLINIREFGSQGAISRKSEIVSTQVILALSFPMFITGFVNMASSQAGVMLLGMFHSDSEVGHYSIALKLATITGFILKAINTVAASKISELYHSDNIGELFLLMKKAAKLIFWTAFPLLVMLLLFGEFLLVTLFGVEFKVAYPALCILVIAQFVNSATGCTGIFMNMVGLQKEYRNIVILGAVLLLSSSAFLTPTYGTLGAASAVLVGECVWNLLALAYIKHKFGKSTGYLPFVGK